MKSRLAGLGLVLSGTAAVDVALCPYITFSQ